VQQFSQITLPLYTPLHTCSSLHLPLCLSLSLSVCLSVCLCGRVAGYIDVVYYIYISVHVTATRPRPLRGCLLCRSIYSIRCSTQLNSTQLVLQCDCRVPTFNTDTKLASAKVRCVCRVVSFHKFHYNDLLPSNKLATSSSTGNLRGNVFSGFWTLQAIQQSQQTTPRSHK